MSTTSPATAPTTAPLPTWPAPPGPGLERHCSVGRTLDILDDARICVVLRECFFGVRTFEKFQAVLGFSRTTLADCLKRLTGHGLLCKVPYASHPPRFEYRLTEAGHAMYPVMMALKQFGDRWLHGGQTPPLRLIHRPCGHICQPYVACSHCQSEVQPTHTTHRPGPGAGWSPTQPGRKSRRASHPHLCERSRPSTVARTLDIIGDRWSFLILREAFFRVRRFDDWKNRLGMAPALLSDRLHRLVHEGILRRVRYQTQPERFEYRLTDKGLALFGPVIAMLRWGDDWLATGQPPLILTHRDCGHDFEPTVVCDHCQAPLRARDMAFVMNYPDPTKGAGSPHGHSEAPAG